MTFNYWRLLILLLLQQERRSFLAPATCAAGRRTRRDRKAIYREQLIAQSQHTILHSSKINFISQEATRGSVPARVFVVHSIAPDTVLQKKAISTTKTKRGPITHKGRTNKHCSLCMRDALWDFTFVYTPHTNSSGHSWFFNTLPIL